MTHAIHFALNGTPTEAACRADTTVLEWLRGEARLRGTKEGCAEGDCGACSILVKRPSADSAEQSAFDGYQAANSCIMLMGQLEGASLVTVEGLAALKSANGAADGHAIQKAMAENGSSQCGFCTPGIVVALAGLLERKGKPQEEDIHDALAGNLCRCTGYRPIVDAAQAAAKQQAPNLPDQSPGDRQSLVGDEDSAFHLPTSLAELLALRARHPQAVLLAGGTDLSIDVAHARARWASAILTRNVAELREINNTGSHLIFGGAVTWEEALPEIAAHWPSFATLVRRFGSVQIRSMGTIAGNLGTASPIGDGAPALLALGAELTLASEADERSLPLDDFFLGYRKTALRSDEIIKSISVPLPMNETIFRVYKISKRYDQDISTVCGAFAAEVLDGKVGHARIAFGGMAATPVRCVKAEAALQGRALDDEGVALAMAAIRDSLAPMSDMRGTSDYRSLVAANLLRRFAAEARGETVEVMAL